MSSMESRRSNETHNVPYSHLKAGTDGSVRFHPSRCHARPEDFEGETEWAEIAKAAFEDWMEEIQDAYPSLRGCLFLTDAAGTWTAVQSLPGHSPSEEELLSVRIGGTYRYGNKNEPDNSGIRTVAIYAADGKMALVVGAIPPDDGGDTGRCAAEIVRELTLLYLPLVYFHGEKASNVRLKALHEQTEGEARKKEAVFQMAHELLTKIDADAILADIIERIREFYPDSELDVLMTQDNHGSHLPVKPLQLLMMEEDSCARAFMEGHIVIDKDKRDGEFQMAVPISGKQGIYGVLRLFSHQGPFETFDIQLMKILSGAAGSAFENAKLYEQSNLLVNELRLINELTKQLNQSLKTGEIFDFAVSELIHIFRADFCCILELDAEKNELVVQASNHPAVYHEKFSSNYGFSGVVFSSKEPVIISDYAANPAVKSKFMELTGSRSLIASPIVVHGEVQGVILVVHRFPEFFTYDNYKLLQVLSGHIGLALANASLHAEVRRMVITDNLTGLYARHYLNEQVDLMQKKDFCGSLIVVDIDNFKQVNDTFGHQVGDQILIQVSRIIKSSIREDDIPARWGGEELAIYLPQVTTEQATVIAERIRNKVEKETDPGVTVSCGVSQWNWQDGKISVETLFYRSDMALYKAKNEGKNCIKTG